MVIEPRLDHVITAVIALPLLPTNVVLKPLAADTTAKIVVVEISAKVASPMESGYGIVIKFVPNVHRYRVVPIERLTLFTLQRAIDRHRY
jgi:hypothetical protein